MKIHYLCPQCEQTAGVEFDADSKRLSCPFCQHETAVPAGAIQDTHVVRCLVCPSEELFVRKDFPQKLGLAIIVAGFALSSVAWYYYLVYVAFGVLFATAMIDAALYIWMGNVVTCYRCHAEYRGVAEEEGYAAFDLEVHERHRQQAARLADAAASAKSVASSKSVVSSNTSED